MNQVELDSIIIQFRARELLNWLADAGRFDRQRAGVDEQDLIDLLELQRLTRELLDHLTAMFPVEEAVELRCASRRACEAKLQAP